MEITEVRIKLMEEASERLQAFCSITFDNAFVIRDLKIIDGSNGPFVAMPSRKLTAHCPQCGCKNHLRAAHCNQCGGRLSEDRLVKDEDGRAKLYADIAHPINSACREMIQDRVIREFRFETRPLEAARLSLDLRRLRPRRGSAPRSGRSPRRSEPAPVGPHQQPRATGRAAAPQPPQGALATTRRQRRAAHRRVATRSQERRLRRRHLLGRLRPNPSRRRLPRLSRGCRCWLVQQCRCT